MSQSIHIEIDRLEGTLLRVLGLIERRGFHIDEIDLYDLGPDTRGLSVSVRPRCGPQYRHSGAANRPPLWHQAA